jgi:hypothetical protein
MNCEKFNEAAIEAIRRIDPDRVILGGYWSSIEEGLDPVVGRAGADGSPARRGLERTLQQISAPRRSVCAVLGVPTMRSVVPYAMAMERRRDIKDDRVGVSRLDALEEYRDVERDFRALEHRGRLTTVDPKTLLCQTGTCIFEKEGQPLYRDSNHLSALGAQFVAPAIEPCFAQVGAR